MAQEALNILTVFKRIYEALSSLPEEELRKLSDPLYSIEVRAVRRRSKDEPSLFPSEVDIEEVIKEISALATRQEAQTILDEKYGTRKLLEPIARRLDIPIVKQDKVEALRDKVIEATVGARIRSQAIQGTGT